MSWLYDSNPHGRPNSDVLRPRLTARDILQRVTAGWIIDFGYDSGAKEMANYALPWRHVESVVKPTRLGNRNKTLIERFWLHEKPRPAFRNASSGIHRLILTPEVSKHRIFVWLDSVYLVDHQTRAFVVAEDSFFGILHSRVHETWARAMGTQLREAESGFRYTPTTCFETFPFPNSTAPQLKAIADAAKNLDDLRTNWLNPPEWTKTELLEFPGSANGPWKRYIHHANENGIGTVCWPRIVPKDTDCAMKLKKRTLTSLYNERPAWLVNAHNRLDEVVFAAYGWPPDLSEDALLTKLLVLNLESDARA